MLVAGCRGLQCTLRRFHARVHSKLHSPDSRSDAIHPFFPIHGGERLYSVPLSQLGIRPIYRAPFRQLGKCLFIEPPVFLPIHRDTATSVAQGPPAKPPQPSFFGIAKRRTSSRSQSKGRSRFLIIKPYNILLFFLPEFDKFSILDYIKIDSNYNFPC